MTSEHDIEALILLAKEHRLTRLLIADEDASVEISLPPSGFAPAAEAPTPVQTESQEEDRPTTVDVRATVVGYFRSPTEHLRVGAMVESDTLLGEIETLGLSNPVLAQARGRIREILIEEGQPVQYGQVIAVLEEQR
jgi:biotin carboxyl carrier protein